MQISGPGPASRTSAPSPVPSATMRPATPASAAATEDTVEISDAARLSAETPEPDPLRTRRLDEIREMIENGTYETTERLEAALSRFLAVAGAQS